MQATVGAGDVDVDVAQQRVEPAVAVDVRQRRVAGQAFVLAGREQLGRGPEIQVQFIEMDFNRHELAEYTDFWLERGAVVKVRRQLSWPADTSGTARS